MNEPPVHEDWIAVFIAIFMIVCILGLADVIISKSV